jgi:hypothetical protein
MTSPMSIGIISVLERAQNSASFPYTLYPWRADQLRPILKTSEQIGAANQRKLLCRRTFRCFPELPAQTTPKMYEFEPSNLTGSSLAEAAMAGCR